MKKFESAWFNRLYHYFLLAQAVYDFLFLLFASSVYSVPALLAPNQVVVLPFVLKQRESVYLIHECQIQPESYSKDRDGWEHIGEILPNGNLSCFFLVKISLFYHQIRGVVKDGWIGQSAETLHLCSSFDYHSPLAGQNIKNLKKIYIKINMKRIYMNIIQI